MASGYGARIGEGSALAAPSTRPRLFDQKLLGQYVADQVAHGLPVGREQSAAVIAAWLKSVSASSDSTESALEQVFNETILGKVLGYRLYPLAGASAWAKPNSAYTKMARTPDVMLGEFSDPSSPKWLVAGELKTPAADLDTPKPTGHGAESPVEQGFAYGRGILGVRWVFVTDMVRLRLYSVEDDEATHEFNLRTCVSPATGAPTPKLDELLALLHHDYLVQGGDAAPVAALFTKAQARQIEIRASFYDLYYEVRADLIQAVRDAAGAQLTPAPREPEILQASQRLLDRLLFIFYCEDHPAQLISPETVAQVTRSAAALPGAAGTRVYQALKLLFREVDTGSPPASGVQVAGYNGELFKPDPIIDDIDLPDSLHHKRYKIDVADGERRVVKGAWGLHEFDFWQELNEHLLGHIFEESLSDLIAIGEGEQPDRSAKLEQRRRGGVYYTASLLADFVASRTLSLWLAEHAPLSGDDNDAVMGATRDRLDCLGGLRGVDLACGSGAFLVSLYASAVTESERLQRALQFEDQLAIDLHAPSRAELLRTAIYGIDLLPQAVEIAKLALWLRSARKGEKVPDLGGNIVTGDALNAGGILAQLGTELGTFDLVVGNPPWGAEMDAAARAAAIATTGLNPDTPWDSWELFVALAIAALKEGGYLGLVLPDSLLQETKARIREHLFTETTVLEVFNLGPDWFGPDVRMGTCLLFARKGLPVDSTDRSIRGVQLSGPLRTEAIAGRTLLDQVASQRGRDLSYGHSLSDQLHVIEPFRGKRDDAILAKMDARSRTLAELTDSGRGEEINKSGLLWRCPSCLHLTVPGVKSKGSFKPKPCESCGLTLTTDTVQLRHILVPKPAANTAPWIDGDAINRRYGKVQPAAHIDLSASWAFKAQSLYTAPKILVRKTGVGINATYDDTGAYFPQTIFFYRLKPDEVERGIDHRFVLGTLLSRTMVYRWFKRSGDVDVAKAFSYLTHSRLRTFPIPHVDLKNPEDQQRHTDIVENVQAMLDGAPLGGPEDLSIEQSLRKLWGLSPDDGHYINGEFFDLADSGQVVRELFPQGVPSPIPAEAPAPIEQPAGQDG